MDNELRLTDCVEWFSRRASKATYAGDGSEVKPWRSGFKELEYSENDWYYRDSYSGYLRSREQEVVWYNDAPTWTCLYGGGMAENNINNEFARKTFSCLKVVLSSGEKGTTFQPRGPKELAKGNWRYKCELEGSLAKFSGHESIIYNSTIVFTHDFIGGYNTRRLAMPQRAYRLRRCGLPQRLR